MPLLLRVPSLLQLLQAVRPRVATPHPAPGQLAARRCLPPAAVACRRGSRAAGGRRGRHGAGKPAAPPRAPPPSPRPAGPPPPRRARLRRSSRLCNVSSRSGGDARGSGWGPAVAASAARPGGRARREPAATSLPPGRCGRFCAPRRGARTRGQPGCGHAQRTADTGLPGLRPGTGRETASRAASAARLPSPGGRNPSRSGPRHMTAATQRPASARAAHSAAPRPPAPGVARAAPR